MNSNPSTYAIPLARLLARLESSLGDGDKLASLNEVELRKTSANVDNARKLLIQLERSEGPGKANATAIAEQRKRILSLHNQIIAAQQKLADVPEPEDEDEEERESSPAKDEHLANQPVSVLRSRLFEDREQGTPADTSTERVLQHHRMTQDELSESMLGMAQGLKQRSIAFGEALKEDSKLIENASGLLSKNADRMSATGGRLQAYSKTSTGMTWLILGAIAAVFAAWLFMYFIIRLT